MEKAISPLSHLNQTTVPATGQLAPDFSLPSIQGESVQLKNYRGKKNIILWFSRGFSCPNCRGFMNNFSDNYDKLLENNIEVIQVSPNLHHSAVNFFGDNPPPFPMICDPDKRLFATYGIGDKGAFRASINTIVSFSAAAKMGEFRETTRASAMDVIDRNFLQRLHHHALTALDQALIVIDDKGKILYRLDVESLGNIPTAPALIQFLKHGTPIAS